MFKIFKNNVFHSATPFYSISARISRPLYIALVLLTEAFKIFRLEGPLRTPNMNEYIDLITYSNKDLKNIICINNTNVLMSDIILNVPSWITWKRDIGCRIRMFIEKRWCLHFVALYFKLVWVVRFETSSIHDPWTLSYVCGEGLGSYWTETYEIMRSWELASKGYKWAPIVLWSKDSHLVSSSIGFSFFLIFLRDLEKSSS